LSFGIIFQRLIRIPARHSRRQICKSENSERRWKPPSTAVKLASASSLLRSGSFTGLVSLCWEHRAQLQNEAPKTRVPNGRVGAVEGAAFSLVASRLGSSSRGSTESALCCCCHRDFHNTASSLWWVRVIV